MNNNYKTIAISESGSTKKRYLLTIEFTPSNGSAIQMFEGSIGFPVDGYLITKLEDRGKDLVQGKSVLELSMAEGRRLLRDGSISAERSDGCYLISLEREEPVVESDIVDAILAERDQARSELQALLQEYEWLGKNSAEETTDLLSMTQTKLEVLIRINAAKAKYQVRADCYQAAEENARNRAIIDRMNGNEMGYRAYLKRCQARTERSMEITLQLLGI